MLIKPGIILPTEKHPSFRRMPESRKMAISGKHGLFATLTLRAASLGVQSASALVRPAPG